MQKVLHIIENDYPEIGKDQEKSVLIKVPCNGKFLSAHYKPGDHVLHLFYLVEEHYKLCQKEFYITAKDDYDNIKDYKYLISYQSFCWSLGQVDKDGPKAKVFQWNHLFVLESD